MTNKRLIAIMLILGIFLGTGTLTGFSEAAGPGSASNGGAGTIGGSSLLVSYGSSIVASDLTIVGLHADKVGDNLEFTLYYHSGIARNVSLFDPPDGNNLLIAQPLGMSPEVDKLKVVVPVYKLTNLETVTMKLYANSTDRNFLYIDLAQLAPLIEGATSPDLPGAVNFGTSLVASDLTLRSLQVELIGDNLEFTLGYDSGIVRNVSLFDPPDGEKLMLIQPQGMTPENHSLKVVVPAYKLKNMETVTMKFYANAEDRNFLYLDMAQLSIFFYEVYPPSDFDRDGLVNIDDLAMFAMVYGKTQEASSASWWYLADLNEDFRIDLLDLMAFKNDYGFE